MDRVDTSLRRVQNQYIAAVMIVTFVVICSLATWATYNKAQSDALSRLSIRHLAVVQAFQSYLNRAEYELSSTAQVLSARTLAPGKELNTLFSNHDEFLFGGLDFFYVEWQNAPPIVDPRARLFTQEPIAKLVRAGRIGRWSVYKTSEGAVLLLYKKNLIAEEGQLLGYLYGFVSLNDNLTLANTLLDSGSLDQVRLLSHEGEKLLEEKALRFEAEPDVLRFSAPIVLAADQNPFVLQIVKEDEHDGLFYRYFSYITILIAAGLAISYFAIVAINKRLTFKALQQLAMNLNTPEVVSYVELEKIKDKAAEHNAYLNTQVRKLDMLVDITHCAIIYCDEVAGVQRINDRAKALFPEAERARTVFDFLPVSCHQPIQKVLKGEVGLKFELSSPKANSIFTWQLYPYVTESNYRGVVLIGRDATKEMQLEWQLSQLQPNLSKSATAVEVQLILNEFGYLVDHTEKYSQEYVRAWQCKLLKALNALLSTAEDAESKAFGEVLNDALLNTPCDHGTHGLLQIDCGLSTALKQSEWSSDLKWLLSSLIMMVYASELVEEKRLSIRTVGSQLMMQVSGIGASRPVYSWLARSFAERLGVECKQIKNNVWSVNFPFLHEGESLMELPDRTEVVWIANESRNASSVIDLLEKLGVLVHRFSSSDSFFTELGDLEKVDALLIGVHRWQDDTMELSKVLQGKLGYSPLPIGWIGSEVEAMERDYIGGCLHEYRLAGLLKELFSRAPMQFSGVVAEESGWLVVGGSGVSRAIVHAELSVRGVVPHLIPSLEGYRMLLRHQKVSVVILLDAEEEGLLRNLTNEFPDILVVCGRNRQVANTHEFSLEKPYRQEQIGALVDYVERQLLMRGKV